MLHTYILHNNITFLLITVTWTWLCHCTNDVLNCFPPHAVHSSNRQLEWCTHIRVEVRGDGKDTRGVVDATEPGPRPSTVCQGDLIHFRGYRVVRYSEGECSVIVEGDSWRCWVAYRAIIVN